MFDVFVVGANLHRDELEALVRICAPRLARGVAGATDDEYAASAASVLADAGIGEPEVAQMLGELAQHPRTRSLGPVQDLFRDWRTALQPGGLHAITLEQLDLSRQLLDVLPPAGELDDGALWRLFFQVRGPALWPVPGLAGDDLRSWMCREVCRTMNGDVPCHVALLKLLRERFPKRPAITVLWNAIVPGVPALAAKAMAFRPNPDSEPLRLVVEIARDSDSERLDVVARLWLHPELDPQPLPAPRGLRADHDGLASLGDWLDEVADDSLRHARTDRIYVDLRLPRDLLAHRFEDHGDVGFGSIGARHYLTVGPRDHDHVPPRRRMFAGRRREAAWAALQGQAGGTLGADPRPPWVVQRAVPPGGLDRDTVVKDLANRVPAPAVLLIDGSVAPGQPGHALLEVAFEAGVPVVLGTRVGAPLAPCVQAASATTLRALVRRARAVPASDVFLLWDEPTERPTSWCALTEPT